MTALTGVLGGMFDPVHLGHLDAARAAREACGLAEVLLIPCGNPVHKERALSSGEDRRRMLELASADIPWLHVDTRECESDAPSRTRNTLLSLREERPDEALCFILGMDSFLSFTTWYRWREIFGLAHLLIITRPGFKFTSDTCERALFEEYRKRNVTDAALLQAENAGMLMLIEGDTPSISSTEIRRRIHDDEPVSGLVPDAVLEFIHSRGLYN